jgi:hypothetical protein
MNENYISENKKVIAYCLNLKSKVLTKVSKNDLLQKYVSSQK